MTQAETNRPASPRWGQERRLEFIDFRLRWDRTLNRGELVDFFRISIQQASADLAKYMELAPGNLEYDRRLKTYRATPAFKPTLTREDAHGYLDQLAALSGGTLASSASFIGWQPPFDVVRYPARPIAADILLQMVWSIRDRRELRVTYQSMRQPDLTERWIFPHALAHDGVRWHVRAWCHTDSEFRDFVLSRVQAVKASRDAQMSADADNWWHQLVDVVVGPRQGLTNAQRAAVQRDFGMSNGRLVLTPRKALAFYLVRQLQLDRPSDRPLAVQPIELLNRSDLKDVLSSGQKLLREGIATENV